MGKIEKVSLDTDYKDEDGPLLLKTDSASVNDVGDMSALEFDTKSANSSDAESVVYDLDSTIASIRMGNPLGSVGKASYCSSRTPIPSTCRSLQSNEFHELSTDEVRYEKDVQEQIDKEAREGPTLSLECITDSIGGLLLCPGLSTRSCLASHSYEDEENLSNNFFNFDDLCGQSLSAHINQMSSVPEFTTIGPGVGELQKKIEHEIDQFLGHTKDVTRLCTSQMQNILQVFANKGGRNSRDERNNDDRPKKIVLRNRNTVIGAKAKRMQTIQDNMGGSLVSSFANSFQTSLEKSYPITKSKSMGNYREHPIENTSDFISIENKESVLSSTQENKIHFEETDLYYDSEPDDNFCGDTGGKKNIEKLKTMKSQPFPQNYAEMKDASNCPAHSEDARELISKDCREIKTHKLHRLSKKYLLRNDDVVIQFIEELTAGFIKLIWHPNNRQHKTSPIYVNAWCELGNSLDDSVVYPKFIWRTTYESEKRQTTRISGPNPSVHKLDLLNIVRVLKPEVIDRSIFPFANRKKSFLLISSTNEIYLFESANQKERDHIVNGIKLTIARLASKIMTGDESVFDEFFTPIGIIDRSVSCGKECMACDSTSERKQQSQFFKYLTTTETTSDRNRRREQGKSSILK